MGLEDSNDRRAEEAAEVVGAGDQRDAVGCSDDSMKRSWESPEHGGDGNDAGGDSATKPCEALRTGASGPSLASVGVRR